MQRNDPSSFHRFQSEIDRMFLGVVRTEHTSHSGKPCIRPNTDVYYDTRQGTLVVKLELAGIDPSQVNLEIEDGVLRVSGVREDERHPDAVYQQMEIDYGCFERAVALPPEVDASKATAQYNAGFLQINIPIKARPSAKRISIATGDEAETESKEGGQTS